MTPSAKQNRALALGVYEEFLLGSATNHPRSADTMTVTSDRQNWQLSSWRAFPVTQQPKYRDAAVLDEVLTRIASYPPLVFAGEVDNLRCQLAAAAAGERFLLQGGDCAERFQDCHQEAITSKIKILLQMSVILCYGARKPIIRVGRIAGQYAKPRSADTEIVDGVELPVFRGDSINSIEATLVGREPDPQRLLQGYHNASMTLNYVRALVTGGFADLHYPEHWNIAFFGHSPHGERYQQMVDNIRDAIAFMESLGGVKENVLGFVDFYTSHEGLLLGFEESLTRYFPSHGGYYNVGAHMLWIGDRTRQLDGAHVEYFRGIRNPIGIKIGPTTDATELVQLVRVLNPTNETGKITLISRLGDQKVDANLPKFIEAIRAADLKVLWSCDPMHGNVVKTKENIKTRDFNAILAELRDSFRVHQQYGSILGGVHFELTGEKVTECTGGADNVTEADLGRQYETYCDPRLNYNQSLEMAFLIAEMLKA
jgi:3-deoxy-7-phosphoheptulonate synthase